MRYSRIVLVVIVLITQTFGQSIFNRIDPTGVFNVSTPNDTLLTIKGNTKRVGIGTNSPLGKLHIKNGNSGVVSVPTWADDLVVENYWSGGISILTRDDSYGRIVFGAPGNSEGAGVYYRHSYKDMIIGTNTAGGYLTLRTGSGSQE